MITEEQKENLKAGDKLIFIENGGTLSTVKNAVFTFANWHKADEFPFKKNYFQSKELLEMGNKEHNFSIWECELFNPLIHKEPMIMNAEKVNTLKEDFVSKYGE